MCYAVGSLQQATSTCPMCKVFRPSASRCPHIKETCRNAANHPRHDVVYLKNAEVATFVGCGFCKWAKTNPPPTRAGYQNPGWPGCCRPPNPSEYKLIGAADWPAVSTVHHVPIPPDIKSILDSITAAPTSPRGTPPLGSPTGSVRGAGLQSAAPTISRRSSHHVASPTRGEPSPRSNAVPIPNKRGSSGSPQQVPTALAGAARGGGGQGDGVPLLTTVSPTEQLPASRRSAMDVFADKRPDPSNTSQCSPGRKHAELGGSIARRSSERRPSVTAIAPSSTGIGKVAGAKEVATQRRRTSPPSNPPSSARSTERSVERSAGDVVAASAARRSIVDDTMIDKVEKLSLSSASSSSSGSSSSETTIISDGGFTDYLSDESEAELQRQAEARAAVVAQNQMEELEFRAARQQLAHVDLQPPRSWRGAAADVTQMQQSTPRSQVRPSRGSNSYGQPPFAGAPAAYAASAASTHSRG